MLLGRDYDGSKSSGMRIPAAIALIILTASCETCGINVPSSS
jgi:hypothetical protein